MSFLKTMKNKAAMGMAMVGMAAGTFLNPTKADAQTKNQRDVWMFNIGASYIPESGAKFEFHGMTPGFGREGSTIRQLNYFEAGARITGKSIGSSVTVEEQNRNGTTTRWTYFGASRQFSTAYLKYTVAAPRLEFAQDGFLMAGAYVQGNVFLGGQNNLLNFADTNLGLTGMVRMPIVGGLGVSASVNAALKTFKSNNNFFSEAAQNMGIVTENELNPKLEARVGLSLRF